MLAFKKIFLPSNKVFLLFTNSLNIINQSSTLLENCSHNSRLSTNIVHYFTTAANVEPKVLSSSPLISEEEKLIEYINSTSQPLLKASKFLPEYLQPVQSWVTNIATGEKFNCIMLLERKVFGVPPRIDHVAEVVRWIRASMRKGLHFFRNRAEMPGSGRKPWPQKGTGRARQGSIRAPHFMSGGKSHAPKPRDYRYNLPKKIQVKGLKSMLTIKYSQNDLIIVDKLVPDGVQIDGTYLNSLLERYNCKTLYFCDVILNPEFEKIVKRFGRYQDKKLRFAYREAQSNHVYDMIRSQKVIITVDAVREVEKKIAHFDNFY